MKRASFFLVVAIGFAALSLSGNTARAQTHACADCHIAHGGLGSPLLNKATVETVCLTCHTAGGAAEIKKDVAVHAGADHGADVTTCSDCHDHEGEVGTNVSNVTLVVKTYPRGSPVDKPVVFDATRTFDDDDATFDGICEVCHTLTTYHRSDGTSDTPHNDGADCATCHSHLSGFQGSGNCTACHDVVRGSRRAILGEMSLSSHHLDWAGAGYNSPSEIPPEDCEVCHDQSNHQSNAAGNVLLKDADTGAVYNSNDPTQLTNFCASCHDADMANGAIPFSDGRIPPVIDGTTWLTTRHGSAMITGPTGINAAAPVAPHADETPKGCLNCHMSGHGVDKDATLFPICETCHGALGDTPAPFADRHFDPSSNPTPIRNDYNMDCRTCHTPHTNVNHKLGVHDHWDNTETAQTTNVGVTNIRLFGRDEDGSGVAKVATPQKILSVVTANPGPAAPCSDSNTAVQINLPPFIITEGHGVPFTIVAGDRIEIDNSDATFDGFYRVKETVWDGLPDDPPTGWVCYDHPTFATYSGYGWVRSRGWLPIPDIRNASWDGANATVDFSGPSGVVQGIHSIIIGDTINVIGVDPTPYNGQKVVNAVTETSVSWAAASDPGTYVSGGTVEYIGSVKEIASITKVGPMAPPGINIIRATWTSQGNPDTATITTGQPHGYVQNDLVTISGVNPSGFDVVDATVRTATATTIKYALATDPGAYVSGGTIPDIGGNIYALRITLNADNDNLEILKLKEGAAGDILRIYGAADSAFNERWEVLGGGVNVAVDPPTIDVRCPPYLRTDTTPFLPYCDISTMAASTTGGTLQTTGTMRETVFDSLGQLIAAPVGEYLVDYNHSFASVDLPASTEDGYKYGPCELCHDRTEIVNHQTDNYSETHQIGDTCSLSCHPHSQGFDKVGGVCPRVTPLVCPPYLPIP
jgi:predicted CXXCH cytochrome family protein